MSSNMKICEYLWRDVTFNNFDAFLIHIDSQSAKLTFLLTLFAIPSLFKSIERVMETI